MPINKPIPDSVIEDWKKVFNEFQSKFRGPKKSVEMVVKNKIIEG